MLTQGVIHCIDRCQSSDTSVRGNLFTFLTDKWHPRPVEWMYRHMKSLCALHFDGQNNSSWGDWVSFDIPSPHSDSKLISIAYEFWSSVLQCQHTGLTNSHLHRIRHAVPVSPVTALPLPSSVAHLVQLRQQDLSEVKDGEADSYRDGPFDPVHTKTFIESTDHPFLCDNLPHGAQNGAVRVTRHSSSLHSAPYHIQRVGRRLADETGTGSKRQTLVRVWLPAPAVLCMGEEGSETHVVLKYLFWF